LYIKGVDVWVVCMVVGGLGISHICYTAAASTFPAVRSASSICLMCGQELSVHYAAGRTLQLL
jgi:hypothetical protein